MEGEKQVGFEVVWSQILVSHLLHFLTWKVGVQNVSFWKKTDILVQETTYGGFPDQDLRIKDSRLGWRICTHSIGVHVLFATASELSWKGTAPWRTYTKFIGIGSQAVGQHELLRHWKGKKYAKVIPGSIQAGMSSRKWEAIPVQAKSTRVAQWTSLECYTR